MTRIKINARRIFSLLIPFFFFTSVHAEQTAAPAKPVTVEAKNETFAPQHPDQYLSWKATSEQSERVDALAEDPRLVILWAGYPFSRDYNKPRGHAFAVTDVRETCVPVRRKTLKMVRYRWHAGVVKARMWRV